MRAKWASWDGPSRVSLDILMAESTELYTHVPPPGRPIPIGVAPFPMDDTIPGEEYISEAVTRLRLHRAGGPLGMKAKHLRMWLRAAKHEEKSTPGSWDKFIAII